MQSQGSEHCGVMSRTSKMNDEKCREKRLFVCEMPAQKDKFKTERSLSDELARIEDDILQLKLKMSK